MDETIGMVTYDERAILNCGAEYPEGEGYDSELILVPTDSDVTDEDEESIMLESRAIGQKIRELVGNLMIGGKDDRRPLTYSDIAILNRSANSYGDLICNELADMDIPCEKTGGTGYFSVIEVETSLAILSVINNPYDDIAMAAVLKSPLFDFSDEELLLIRMAGGDIGFCESIMDVPTDKLHEETATKLSGFRTFLDNFRSISEYESVDALLYRIYDETGYLSYVTALPGGEKRRRNLEKLLDMAQAYSKTSYRGIYHFVKYIEKMKKYEIDQKDPEGDPETDSVRLMTIHKSKGLEFPVVFVCGLSKGIRFDRDVFSVSDKYGFGLDIYDRENSLKINTFHKSMISYFEKEQVIGEEARVLYVAMTRAREKLIMTAALKQNDIDKILEGKPVPQKVTYNKKISAVNYLKMVLPAFLSKAHRSHIYEASPESLIIREVIREHNRPDREIFLKMAGDKDADDISRELLERSRFTYDTGSGTEWKSKYSVSMIKKQAFMEAVDGDGETMQLFAPEPELTEYVPRFMGGSGEVSTGAERGTAMHRFLECFDFKKDDLSGAIDEEIRRQVDGGFLQEDQEKLLQIARLRKFLGSDLAGRMHRASLAGELFRERTFVMGDKPRAFFEDIAGEDEVFSDDDPQVLVQGIIDAYFIEDGKVFLIDYKTDRVDTKEELLTRYRKQMLLYQDVLNRTLHLEPGGAYMYSFALESLVEV
jgi:ATP-dependent helicase/nuclease subunit A